MDPAPQFNTVRINRISRAGLETLRRMHQVTAIELVDDNVQAFLVTVHSAITSEMVARIFVLDPQDERAA